MRNGREVIDIHEIWKAVYVALKTGRKPEYPFDPINNFVRYRFGQPTAPVFDALEQYADSKNEFRKFAEIFKQIRNATFDAKKGGGHDR